MKSSLYYNKRIGDGLDRATILRCYKYLADGDEEGMIEFLRKRYLQNIKHKA